MRDGDTESIMKLCDVVRQTGFDLRAYLGSGHLEKVYENGLAHRLRKQSVEVEQQAPITVCDEDGTVLGEYLADLLVEGVLIVELKASRAINPDHVAQILGYLKATHIEHGLLINFGASKYEIKKYVLSQT
jgi:GxxExxY protein